METKTIKGGSSPAALKEKRAQWTSPVFHGACPDIQQTRSLLSAVLRVLYGSSVFRVTTRKARWFGEGEQIVVHLRQKAPFLYPSIEDIERVYGLINSL